MFSRWFLTSSIPLDLCIPYDHEKWLVALSYVVAVFASYTAFHVIERIKSATDSETRRIWLVIAGCVMGSGIFAMHFIAMLAVRSPIFIYYDLTVTAMSALFAIVASGVAFHLVGGREKESRARFVIAAVILGSGIGLMHYTGMAALRMAAHIYYDPYLFALSVVVAVLLSACALYVLRKSSQWRRLSAAGIHGARLCGALVMGLAITMMHYTGMFATYFYPKFDQGASGTTLDSTIMSIAIGTIAFVIGGFAIIAALLDHRATAAEASRAQTESFLQTVIDNSVDGILTLDADQNVKTCNPAAARIFGRDADNIVGRRFYGLISDDLEPALAQSVQLREAHVVRADKSECNIEYSINAMRYSGRLMYTSLIRDITERKRAEAALRASEERFRNLVANVPGVVFQRQRSVTGALSLTYVSEQIRELSGLEPDEVIADYTKLFDTIHPEDKQAFLDSISDSALSLGPSEQMYRMVAKSGQTIWIRSFSRPRLLKDGEIVWDGLLLDVTNSVDQVEKNKMLESKLRQAQKLEALGTLAGGIAHEFNNMLVPIMGLTEITLRDLPEDSRAHKNLKVVVNNGNRAAQLIEKILSFSRQEENAVEDINLCDVVSEAIELLKVATPATITLHANLDPTVGLILADETQIHQIVMNLASNARHAMEGKIGDLTIELSAIVVDSGQHANLKPGKYAKLSVKDSGHGIDKETLSRIFEPFFTTKKVGKGTGLGLSVIHGIVTNHGGAIEVSSTPGVGTTFDVYLPAKADIAQGKSGEQAA